jgi:hypothetical protein
VSLLQSTKKINHTLVFSLLTCFTCEPAFALVSINMTFSSFAFASPSSVDTCLKRG